MAALIMVLCGPEDLLKGSIFIERPLIIGTGTLPRGLPLVRARLWLSRNNRLCLLENLRTLAHDYVATWTIWDNDSGMSAGLFKQYVSDAPQKWETPMELQN